MSARSSWFEIQALRRQDGDSAGQVALLVGRRLARLLAEAKPGIRLATVTCAQGSNLRVRLAVSAGNGQTLGRLPPGVDVQVADLATEVAGLLEEYALVGPIHSSTGVTDANPAAPVAGEGQLIVVPRGLESVLKVQGFSASPTRSATKRRSLALPRNSDPDDWARLLLAHPDVTLVQELVAAQASDAEDARDEMAHQLPAAMPNPEVEDAIGIPVRGWVKLIGPDPSRIPLRFREALRGWFTGIDYLDDENEGSEVTEAPLLPEVLAAGVIRLPVTLVDSFPGLPVEPVRVPLLGEPGNGDGIRLGHAHDIGGRTKDVVVPAASLARHVHVMGETGTGKSTLLTAMAVETARRGEGLLLLDPHGSTVDRVLGELPTSALDRTWVIRCGDVDNPVRLNPFAVASPRLRDLVIAEMVEAFQVLFDPRHEGIVGPRFQHMMRQSLLALSDAVGPRACLLDVPRMHVDARFERAIVAAVTTPEVRDYWLHEYRPNRSSELGEVKAWVNSKFGAFATSAAVRAMLETGADSFDPTEAMASNRIVLVDLDKGGVGTLGARVIGLLYLIRYWTAALTRDRDSPCTLLIDEAHAFSATALSSMLAEGRKFGLKLVVAHQFHGQLDDRLSDAIEGSTGTKIAFRVGREDAAVLLPSMAPEFGVLDLMGLPMLQAAARIADSGRALRPFTLVVDHTDRTQPGPRQLVAEVEARSRRDLVNPYRSAERLEPPSSQAPSTAQHGTPAAPHIDDILRNQGGWPDVVDDE